MGREDTSQKPDGGSDVCTWAEASCVVSPASTQSPVGGTMPGSEPSQQGTAEGPLGPRKGASERESTNVSITKQMGLGVIIFMDFENIMCL